MKARSYPSMLEQSELGEWRSFVAEKLSSSGDWLNLATLEGRIDELSAEENLTADRHAVLERLAEHAGDLRTRYQI